MVSKKRELLELFIITYNRAIHLENTLRQLIGCPFSKFSITILDNCSTDNTHEIFFKYKSDFPCLNYIKNKINIGADANVLRAAELSNGIYTWILCDDDYYDFTDCNDVLIEMAKKEAAAIMVGWSEPFAWPKGGMYDTAENLIKKGFPCLSVPTFVPGSIFKTDLFQAQIRSSYTNIVNLLPAMTFYIGLYNKPVRIYVSHHKLVVAAGAATYDYTFLKVMAAAINTFYLIERHIIRRHAFYACYLSHPYFSIYKHALMWQKAGSEFPLITKWRYFKLVNWKGKLIFIFGYAIAPLANRVKLPEAILKIIKKNRI